MRSTIIALFACTTAACVGAPPPPPSRDDGSSSGTAGTTSAGPITTTGEDRGDTLNGTEHGTTSSADTTEGASTADEGTGTTAGTTMGVDPTTGSSGPPPVCMGPEKCGANEDCVGGQCVSACAAWGPGNYDYCLTELGTFDSAALCGAVNSCVYSGSPIEVAVCARSCNARCDCPAPPPTGTAPVTCGELTPTMGNECYLSCESGEMCPDDMFCQNGTYCTHPAEPLAVYGNCGAVNAGCDGGECATATNGVDTWAVCVTLCPGGDGDCDPAPAGAPMGEHCAGVIFPPDGAECHVDCTITADCPMGMVCIDTGLAGHSTLCMWPS